MSGRPHRTGAPPRWTPVDQLSRLARRLLSDDLGGRDAVPAHVADRVTALAARWVDHGFTAETVGPWVDLAPADAAYLARRGVEPDLLDRVVDTDPTASPVTLRRALATGQLDAPQAYDLLASTGDSGPPTRGHLAPFGSSPDPAAPPAPQPVQPTRPSPAPAVFSHPTADHPADRDSDGDADRTKTRRAAHQPSRTPFRP